MKNGICYIVGAGEAYRFNISPNESDYVIAADGGYAHLVERGIRADFVMGDFDSLPEAPHGENVLRFQAEKDDTDMMLAVKHGLSQGYRHICIYGGMGGRFSHTLANVQALGHIAGCGARGYLYGDGCKVTVITNDEIEFCCGEDFTVSVLAYNGEAQGVTIRGMKYELNDATMREDYPLGISNEALGTPAKIAVRNGSLIIIWEAKHGFTG